MIAGVAVKLPRLPVNRGCREYRRMGHPYRRLATRSEVAAFITENRFTKRQYDTARQQRADVKTVMYPASVHMPKHYSCTFNELLSRRVPGSGYATIEEVQRLASGRTQDQYDRATRQENAARDAIFPRSSKFPTVYGATFGEVTGRRAAVNAEELAERAENRRVAREQAQDKGRPIRPRRTKAQRAVRAKKVRERYQTDEIYREKHKTFAARNYVENYQTARERMYYSSSAKRYGVKRSDIEALLEAQQRLCAGCKQPPQHGTRLQVDHCHTTGAIRGLLCGNCNRALGQVKDCPDRLGQLYLYITRWLRSQRRSNAV